MPRWFFWSIVALISWGIWGITPKFIGNSLSATQSQALSTIGLIPMMAAIWFLPRSNPPDGKAPFGRAFAFAAGLFACLGNMTYYDAINSGGKAATIVSLTALYPLVTILLAMILLKERLGRIQQLGIILSVAAIYLFNVADPSAALSPAISYVLLPIVCWGTAGLLQKISTNHISGELSTLWFLAAFFPVSAFLLWQEPSRVSLPIGTWAWVIALGLFFALGNYGILAAFAAQGKASVITPLTALYPVVSVPLAILFFGEQIHSRELIGIILALSSVVALSTEPQR